MTEVVSFRLPGDQARMLARVAEVRGCTVTDLLREATAELIAAQHRHRCDLVDLTVGGVALLGDVSCCPPSAVVP